VVQDPVAVTNALRQLWAACRFATRK